MSKKKNSYVSLHHHSTSCEVAWGGVGRPPTRWCQRLSEKIEVNELGCWVYLPAKDKTDSERPGSMVFSAPGIGAVHVTRWFWEQERGPVPAGLELDHFYCNNWRCINLDHLEPVTPKINGERYAPIRATWTRRDDLGRFAGRR